MSKQQYNKYQLQQILLVFYIMPIIHTIGWFEEICKQMKSSNIGRLSLPCMYEIAKWCDFKELGSKGLDSFFDILTVDFDVNIFSYKKYISLVLLFLKF